MTEALVDSGTTHTIQDYCCIHHGLHTFSLLALTPDSRFSGAELPSGEEARFYLRSDLPCAVERLVAPRSLSSTTPQQRWSRELDFEEKLMQDSASVPAATRRSVLLDILDQLDQAIVVPESACNRLIAKVLGISALSFAATFALTLVTHWTATAYLSGAGLIACILSPFVAKGAYSYLWKRSVMSLVPEAITPLGLDQETLALGLDHMRFPNIAKRIDPQRLGV